MQSPAVPSSTSPHRSTLFGRRSLRLAAAAMICGLGLSASLVTLVRAADDAGILAWIRSDALNRAARAVRLDRYAAEPGPRLAATAARPGDPREHRPRVARRARAGFAAANARLGARLTMCVRSCDGFAFPLGRLGASGDIPAHQAACAAACPGADTKLYTLAPGRRVDDLAGARSVADGSPYRRLRTAFLYRTSVQPSCSCQGPGNVATRLPILLDPTLRSGDVVIDKVGRAKVYAGPGRIPHSPRAFADFRTSPALAKTARAQVDRLVGTSQKEAAAQAFERTLRTRRASLDAGGFVEVSAPAGSFAGVRVYQARHDAGTLDPSGARIIVVR